MQLMHTTQPQASCVLSLVITSLSSRHILQVGHCDFSVGDAEDSLFTSASVGTVMMSESNPTFGLRSIGSSPQNGDSKS
jgi:hypothetical protein